MSPIMMEVIEWFDRTSTGIVQRYPEEGSGDIKMGAQLIVRENQAAVFFRDGQALDASGPGRHTLSTQNLPIITRLLSLPWGFQSPFRAAVYFVSLKVFTNMRWGTRDPVAFKASRRSTISAPGSARSLPPTGRGPASAPRCRAASTTPRTRRSSRASRRRAGYEPPGPSRRPRPRNPRSPRRA
jgi:hypothetical protein